jgi:farnesol dehydrogenase
MVERLGTAVDIAIGDIRDADRVADACRDVEVVYHLAALAKPWAKDPGEFFDVNRTGTDNVCRAAEECGVRRLLHASTPLVSAPAGVQHAATVTRITPYQRSKAEGEIRVRAFVDRGGDAVIVRPTRVFGPGLSTAGNTVTRLIDLYRRGRFRFRIADRGARANYVLVDDVVDGMLRAADRGSAGETYALGGSNLSLPEFLQLIEQAGARPRRVFAVPQPIASVVALGYEMSAWLGAEPDITRDWARLLAVDWPVSSEMAESELGFSATPLDEAIRITLGWLEAGSKMTKLSQLTGGRAA